MDNSKFGTSQDDYIKQQRIEREERHQRRRQEQQRRQQQELHRLHAEHEQRERLFQEQQQQRQEQEQQSTMSDDHRQYEHPAAADVARQRPSVRIADLPEYSGSEKESLDDYAADVVAIKEFYGHGISETQLVAGLTLRLKGDARHYFLRYCASVDEPPTTFDEFYEVLSKKYADNKRNFVRRQHLSRLRQTGSVASYTHEFERRTGNLSDMNEHDLFFYYVQGLKPRTREAVIIANPPNVDTAMQIAERYDNASYNGRPQQRRWNNNASSSSSSSSSSSYRGRQGPWRPNGGNRNMQSRSSFVHGKPRLAKLSDAERKSLRDAGACFRCRQTGHLAKDCPKNG